VLRTKPFESYHIISDEFKQIIRAQDSQEQWRKDVPVEHEDEFGNLPVKSRILHESGARREKKDNRQTSRFFSSVFKKLFVSYHRYATLEYDLKTHLEVECKAMIVEKDGLRYGVIDLEYSTRNKAKGTKRATREF
jgi:hypothetical protein